MQGVGDGWTRTRLAGHGARTYTRVAERACAPTHFLFPLAVALPSRRGTTRAGSGPASYARIRNRQAARPCHAPPMNVSGGSRAGAEAVSSGSPECPGGTGRGGVARERSARRHLNEAMQHRRAALHLQPGYARTSPPTCCRSSVDQVGPRGSCELATRR